LLTGALLLKLIAQSTLTLSVGLNAISVWVRSEASEVEAGGKSTYITRQAGMNGFRL
jgi:hypothetical protein